MKVTVSHTLGDLESDFRTIARQAPRDMQVVVRESLKLGNDFARDFARISAGSHGKHYHRAFSAEMDAASLDGASGEYGPDIAKPQGGMSFERGSRNQRPHLDLARSADLIGPAFADEVADLPDRWFWPDS